MPERVQGQIRTYLDGFERPGDRREAVEKIYGQLLRLRRDPKLGTQPPGVLGFRRRLFLFEIEVDGARRALQVAYRFDEDAGVVLILSFGPIQF